MIIIIVVGVINYEIFYLTTHSTYFNTVIRRRTYGRGYFFLILREETRCRYIGYSFRLAARVLLLVTQYSYNIHTHEHIHAQLPVRVCLCECTSVPIHVCTCNCIISYVYVLGIVKTIATSNNILCVADSPTVSVMSDPVSAYDILPEHKYPLELPEVGHQFMYLFIYDYG